MALTRDILAVLFTASLALAQTQTQTPPSAPDAKPAEQAPAVPPGHAWSIGPVDYSGIVDIYTDKNFNNPASGFNGVRNFDQKANMFGVNMAKFTLSHNADPVGFRLDFGFGRAFETIHLSEPKDAPAILRNVEQAYVTLKPPKGKGFQLDVGQFVTSAGAEVIETKDNWNYSRSLLFSWAAPYYHFGLRTSMPVGKYFTGGFQLVNGWNVFLDNNHGKTMGFTGNFATKKISWFNTYYGGPENVKASGWRDMYDTVVLLTPSNAFNAYVEYNYTRNKFPGSTGPAHYSGVAFATRFSKGRFAASPRIEIFDDPDGFSTGTAQRLKEFTLTGEMRLRDGVLARLEYRHDWSNAMFFERGLAGFSRRQDTVLIGLLTYFGPKR